MSSFIGLGHCGTRKEAVEELKEFLRMRDEQQEPLHGIALVYGGWGVGKRRVITQAKEESADDKVLWVNSKPYYQYQSLSVNDLKDLVCNQTGNSPPKQQFHSAISNGIVEWIDDQIDLLCKNWECSGLVIWYLVSDFPESDRFHLKDLFTGYKHTTRKMILQARQYIEITREPKPKMVKTIQLPAFTRGEAEEFIKQELYDRGLKLVEDLDNFLVSLVARLGGRNPKFLEIACTLVGEGDVEFKYKDCTPDELRTCIEKGLFEVTKYRSIWEEPLRELGKVISYESETNLEVHGLLIEEGEEECPVVLIRRYQELTKESSSYDDSIERGVLGVLTGDSDAPIGVAFWVKQGVIVTCTHVIRDAVDAMDIEEKNVSLRSFSRDIIEAEVVYCEAPMGTESENLSARHEVCVLKPISSDENFYRYTFDEGYSAGQKVVAFGFPVKNPAGKYTSVDPEKAITISGEFGDGYVELQGDDVSEQIEQGMSGSPLLSAIDDKREDILDRNIVGMMRGKYPWDDKGLMIPSQLIIQVINNSNS